MFLRTRRGEDLRQELFQLLPAYEAMTKKEHVQLWNKKQGKETGVNVLSVRSSLKGGKSVGPQAKLTPAQKFLQNLKEEIKKAA